MKFLPLQTHELIQGAFNSASALQLTEHSQTGPGGQEGPSELTRHNPSLTDGEDEAQSRARACSGLQNRAIDLEIPDSQASARPVAVAPRHENILSLKGACFLKAPVTLQLAMGGEAGEPLLISFGGGRLLKG